MNLSRFAFVFSVAVWSFTARSFVGDVMDGRMSGWIGVVVCLAVVTLFGWMACREEATPAKSSTAPPAES